MAMTVVSTRQVGDLEAISCAWTSDGSGNQTQAIQVNGVILRVVTDPGATAPTDNYDVTLVDDYGLDLFAAQGMNRDATASEHFCPGLAFTDGTTTSVMPMAHKG